MSEHRSLPRPLTRRRVALASGAAVALLLTAVGSATAGQAEHASKPSAASAPRSGAVVLGGLEVKVVAPYEPVDINADLQMGLLPTGRQNYVISSPDTFAEAVEAAKGYVGDDIRPDSISLGVDTEQGEVTLISGAWRLAGTPRDITVSFGKDIDYAAQLVRLPGRPGWGTFYLDTRGQDLPDTFTVTARDQAGKVFATLKHEPWPAG
ncbi:hypothetical protein [Streptomyces sp. NPDC057877]|uniref:hypothetical protein n=1 Tax=Streptomyces sp. NPDC057877 TaxID=3346269 RepID=UPI0036BD3BB3